MVRRARVRRASDVRKCKGVKVGSHHRAYNPTVHAWVAAPLLVVALQPQAPAAGVTGPVATVFRVFDGTTEVTASTRLRVTPAGRRDAPAIDARVPITPLPAALYDVQASRVDDRGVVAVRWAERLAVMHYPDEGGRHLEVINFQPGFGALQLRATGRRLAASEVAMFRAGDRSAPVGTLIAGDDYLFFVVPAARYDVRVQHREHDGTSDTHWLLGLEVPADRTRLKLIPQP